MYSYGSTGDKLPINQTYSGLLPWHNHQLTPVQGQHKVTLTRVVSILPSNNPAAHPHHCSCKYWIRIFLIFLIFGQMGGNLKEYLVQERQSAQGALQTSKQLRKHKRAAFREGVFLAKMPLCQLAAETKTKLRSGSTAEIVTHVRRPSTATCKVLTSYHNIPRVHQLPGWHQCHALTKVLSFCHKTGSNRKLSHDAG